MTSKERLYNRILGKPVDKIPNLNILMTFAAQEIGIPYGEYVTDYRKLVEGNLVCADKYGIDCVCAISDSFREAHAFGAEITIPFDDVPYCKNPLLGEDVKLSKLKNFDVFENERTLDRINAIDLFKAKTNGEIPIIGWVEGVLAEAADIRGVNSLMLDLAMDESYLTDLFDFIFAKACEFALAQINSGADIIGIGNAVASLVGPEMYKKYAVKYDQALIKFIKNHGAMVKLHICGNITSLLTILKNLEIDIIDIDYQVDFAEAVSIFSDINTSISGNLNPVSVFFQGDATLIKKETKALIDLSDETTIISGGCEIPKGTPTKNMLLMNDLLSLG